MVPPLWKTVWRFLRKLKTDLPHDAAILLLSTHQKEMKAGTQTDIYLCTQVHGSISHSGQKVEATQVSIDGDG